ncbi:MAG TPA: peptidylprolyl isomerase [bacterium]|nr:peptidylprolyl isomerase [bacterium]
MPSRIHLLAAAMILAAMILAASGARAKDPPPAFPDPAEIPDVEAVFTVERFGEFRVGFFRDEVPNHVAAFLTLAGSGWYDGMSFHRVIPGYLIQTGDPASRDMDLENDGPGGADFTLPAEPTERTHLRGTVAMAWRGDDPASAGSQFFIVLDDVPALDGKATPIGEVTAGMDTVDRISQVSTHRNRNPLDRVIIQSVTLTSPGGEAGADTATSPGAATAADTAGTDPEGD